MTWPVELAGRLLFGWVLHLQRMGPDFVEKWPATLLPLGALILATWLVHRFVRWCLRARGSIRIWAPRHTLAVTGIFLSGCLAAIALSGVAHQLVWLGRGKVVEVNHHGQRVEAISNGRALGMALMEYHLTHGRYPRSLEHLEVPWRSMTAVARGGSVREPFIFLLPMREGVARKDEALLVSPVITRDGRVVVIYGDMSVRTESLSRSLEVLENARAGRTE